MRIVPEERIKARLHEVGACAVGIAVCGPVDAAVGERYEEWLAASREAGMEYMRNHMDLRPDPRGLLEGCRSLICLAFGYDYDNGREPGLPAISDYACLPDYHVWIKRCIRESGIGEILGVENEDWRVCVDSAPVAERYWAQKAGVGIIGDNGMVIVPGIGSKVFLAEILTKMELTPDSPLEGDCGHCGACRRACPTGALLEDGMIDCNRCLSYLTIEHRGEWTDERHLAAMRTAAGRSTLFGCDRCVNVCPHNHRLRRREGKGAGDECVERPLEKILTLTAEDVMLGNVKLKGSCLQRAGRKGLLRNALNIVESGEGRGERIEGEENNGRESET